MHVRGYCIIVDTIPLICGVRKKGDNMWSNMGCMTIFMIYVGGTEKV